MCVLIFLLYRVNTADDKKVVPGFSKSLNFFLYIKQKRQSRNIYPFCFVLLSWISHEHKCPKQGRECVLFAEQIVFCHPLILCTVCSNICNFVLIVKKVENESVSVDPFVGYYIVLFILISLWFAWSQTCTWATQIICMHDESYNWKKTHNIKHKLRLQQLWVCSVTWIKNYLQISGKLISAGFGTVIN